MIKRKAVFWHRYLWLNSFWKADMAKRTCTVCRWFLRYHPADFRKYACVEDSIADHSAYLLGAMNGSKQRYEDVAGMTDYKKVVQLIKAGGCDFPYLCGETVFQHREVESDTV